MNEFPTFSNSDYGENGTIKVQKNMNEFPTFSNSDYGKNGTIKVQKT
jgi:hypothetical protein